MSKRKQAIVPLCVLAVALASAAAGCQSASAPSAPPAKFNPTGGATNPKVEEASLIKAVKNNGHIPPNMKPQIIQQIQAQFKMAAKVQAMKTAQLKGQMKATAAGATTAPAKPSKD